LVLDFLVFEYIKTLVVNDFEEVCFGGEVWVEGVPGFPEIGEGGVHDIFGLVDVEVIFEFAVDAELGVEYFEEGFKVGFQAEVVE
jgi:hypothetical protein